MTEVVVNGSSEGYVDLDITATEAYLSSSKTSLRVVQLRNLEERLLKNGK
jgi:hypothetical protein